MSDYRRLLARLNPSDLAYFGAVALPPACIAAMIHWHGVNVPYWDEWDTIPRVIKAFNGTLTFQDLWSQHNEHRLLLVNIISIVLAKATSYDLKSNMYCGFGFQILSLVLIGRLIRITCRNARPVLIRPLTICASLLIFSTAAWECWTWAMASVQFLLSVLWAVATVWALTEWPGCWRGVAIAFSTAILGACTAASGLPLFAVLIVGILWVGREGGRVRWAQLGFVVLLTALFVAFYFIGWNSVSHSTQAFSVRSAAAFVEYPFTYLGSPFVNRGSSWKLAFAFGVLGSSLFSFHVWRILHWPPGRAASVAPWVLLAVFVVLNAGLTTVGRFDLGAGQGVASRYTDIALLFWISLLVLSCALARRSEWRPRGARESVVAAILGAALIAGYAVRYWQGYERMVERAQALEAASQFVLDYKTAPDEVLLPLHPFPATVREQAEALDQFSLGPFAQRRPDAEAK